MRVRQIENMLDLVEVYARERAPMTLSEIARQLGIPKSSAFNVIETLMQRGFLYETRPRAGYYPTSLLLELSRSISDADPLLQRLHPELEALAAATGETALLSMREGGEIIYLDVVESASAIRYFAKVGQRRPLHTTSSGKAILSTFSDSDRRKILSDIYASQAQQSMAIEAVQRDIDACIERGWSEDIGATMTDVMGFGVPISTNRWRLGLALAGPIYRMQAARERLVGQLMETRAAIMPLMLGSG